MANPTYADLTTEFRLLVNDTDARVYSAATVYSWINQGIGWQHDTLKRRLDSPAPHTPRQNHPYWRQYWSSSTISLVSGTSEYSLPSTETDRFDIFDSLVEASTLEPLSPYEIVDENVLKYDPLLGVGRNSGFYTFAPSGKIRVLVAPGYFGVPKEARSLTLRYWRAIYLKASPSSGDTVDVRLDFQRAPVLWAAYRALGARETEAQTYYQEALTMVAAIPE